MNLRLLVAYAVFEGGYVVTNSNYGTDWLQLTGDWHDLLGSSKEKEGLGARPERTDVLEDGLDSDLS